METMECCGISVTRRGPDGRDRAILADLSVAFSAGTISLVTGPTGAGKSTLVHLLGGLIRPGRGEVRCDGAPISRWVASHLDRWRREVGIVFQSPHLVEELTVLENVMLPLVPRALPVNEIRRRSRDILDRIDAAHLAGERISSLSGGEAQAVSIARALVAEPSLILADEPSTHQDAARLERLLELFEGFRKKDAVIVITSHDPRMPGGGRIDRHVTLSDGKLEGAG